MNTQSQKTDALNAFFQEMQTAELEAQKALDAGIPALHRLFAIAQGDTGQCQTVRKLLLGLYNGNAFPFALYHLRGVDKSIYEDCMAVIHMDATAPQREIHKYLDNGPRIFKAWAEDALKQRENS